MNFKSLIRLSALFVLFAVVISGVALAQAEVYITPDGDDIAGDGTSGNPYRSLATAAGAADDGATIYIGGGTYAAAQTINQDKALTLSTFTHDGVSIATFTNTLAIDGGAAVSVQLAGATLVFTNQITVTNGILNANGDHVDFANIVVATNGAINLAGSVEMGSLTVNGAGEANFAGDVDMVSITANDDAAVDIAGDAELTGNITANNNAVVEIGGSVEMVNLAANNSSEVTIGGVAELNNLTVAAAADVNFNGSAVYPDGAVNVAGDVVLGAGTVFYLAATQNVLGAGEIGGAGSIEIAATGNVTLTGNITFGVNLLLRENGALSLGANTLVLHGDFINEDGSTFSGGTGNLQFAGEKAQQFRPRGIQVYNFTVSGDGTVLTIRTTLNVLNNITIGTDALVNLGQSGDPAVHIRLLGAGTFLNNGGYTTPTSVAGYIIVEQNYNFSGTGVYGNIDIRDNRIVTLTSNIKFSGNLIVRHGEYRNMAFQTTITDDFVPVPLIRVVAGLGQVRGEAGVRLVYDEVPYDLVFEGSAAHTTQKEIIPEGIRNLSVVTTGATTVTHDGSFKVSGALTINSGQTLAIGANAVELTGAGTTSTVAGTLTGNVLVSANNVTLNGSATEAHAAQIGNLNVNATGFTSDNLQVVANIGINGGAVINMPVAGSSVANATLTAGSLNLSLNGATSTLTGNVVLTAGAMTLTRHGTANTIGGTVTLTAGSLTLGSKVVVVGATSQVAGNLVLGAYDYVAQAAYSRTGAGTITAGAGYLELNYDGNFTNSTALSLPNLRINGDIAIVTSALTVTGILAHTAGEFALGNLNVTVTGSTYTFAAGTYTAGTGTLILRPAVELTVAGNGSPTIPRLTIDGNVLVTPTTATPPVARTITVGVLFTHTSGLIDLGINHLAVGTTYTRAAGTYAMTSGRVRLVGDPTAFTPGTGMVVGNLEYTGAVNLGGTNPFTVGSNLHMVGGAFALGANNRLVLSDGATVTRTAGTLSHLPSFGSNISVNYAGAVTTANELPAQVLGLTIGANVTLNAAVTVNGTLTLSATLNNAAHAVTIADGALIVQNAGGSIASDAANRLIFAGSYNLTLGNIGNTGATNLWPAGSVIPVLTINPGAANTLTLSADRTARGSVVVASGTFDLDGNDLTVWENLNFAAGSLVNSGAGADLVFGGASNGTLTIAGTVWNVPASINFILNKTNSANVVTLAGGNLNFVTNSNEIHFVRGLLATGDNIVIIQRSGGYTRNVAAGQASHIVGNVRMSLPTGTTGRFEFPVGANPQYRPFTVTFTGANPTITATTITVNHVDAQPLGSLGLPLDGGEGVQIGKPSDFYWLVGASPSLGASQVHDIEVVGTKLRAGDYDDVSDLRLIRRFDGDATLNQWRLQGTGATYSNILQVVSGDSIVTVRDQASAGGLVEQKSRWAIGMPVSAPIFLEALPDTTIAEGDTLSFTYVGQAQVVGRDLTLSLVEGPEGAEFDAETGEFTYIPGYGDAGEYTVIVQADDGELTSTTSATITVTKSPQDPVFVTALSDTTIYDSVLFEFQYVAEDVHGDTLTYELVEGPDDAELDEATGLFSWTPAFAQIGMDFVVTVVVTNESALTDTTTATISVALGRALGDVDGDGVVRAADAALVLQHVAQLVTLEGTALWAADVSGDGSVSAFDAALILQYVAEIIDVFPAEEGDDNGNGEKRVAGNTAVLNASGSLAWAGVEAGESADTYKVRLALAEGAANVFSVQLSALIDPSADIESVRANLPESWMMAQNVVNGELIVAMAGATPLTGRDVLTITLRSESTEFSLAGIAMLNENVSIDLGNAQIRALPGDFALEQNYPNPFNPVTNIRYQLPHDTDVKLEIFNMAGQRVRTLVNETQEAGYYTIEWNSLNENGMPVSSGVYIYRIQAGSFISVNKMLLIK